jgi:TRAP-type C4-dicarboxylate transport system substrate-binding protein
MQSKRREFVRSTAALAAAASLGPAVPAYGQQKTVWKASDVHPLGYPTVEAIVRMGNKLEKATNGRISIQMFPLMQLGGEKEMIEQAQVGALQRASRSVRWARSSTISTCSTSRSSSATRRTCGR